MIPAIIDYISYSCNFDWNDKKIDLNIWNGLVLNGGSCGGGKTHWVVLEDGFYFRCVGRNGLLGMGLWLFSLVLASIENARSLEQQYMLW